MQKTIRPYFIGVILICLSLVAHPTKAYAGVYKANVPSGDSTDITCKVNDASCEWSHIVTFTNVYGDFLFDSKTWTHSNKHLITYSSCNKGYTEEEDFLCHSPIEPDHAVSLAVEVKNPQEIGKYYSDICIDGKNKAGDSGYYLGGECLTIIMDVVDEPKATATPTASKPTATPTPTSKIVYLGPPVKVTPTNTPTPTDRPQDPSQTPTPTLANTPTPINQTQSNSGASDSQSTQNQQSDQLNTTGNSHQTDSAIPNNPTPTKNKKQLALNNKNKRQPSLTLTPESTASSSATGLVLGENITAKKKASRQTQPWLIALSLMVIASIIGGTSWWLIKHKKLNSES